MDGLKSIHYAVQDMVLNAVTSDRINPAPDIAKIATEMLGTSDKHRVARSSSNSASTGTIFEATSPPG